MMFETNQTVEFQGREWTVVRGKPDGDGDITIKGPDGMSRYAKADMCTPVGPKATIAAQVGITSRPMFEAHDTQTARISKPEPIPAPTQPKGNDTMSNALNTSRRTVQVSLIDQDVNLEGKEAIVLELGSQITEGGTQELIQELIMDPANKVAEALKAHNDKRATVVNREVLNRTGNKVKLEPVKMRDLHWDIR